MTIEEHIKKAMADCPLTEQQEGKLLLGIENYLNEIERVKNYSIPDVVERGEQSPCVQCSGNGGGVTDDGWEKCDCQN